MFLHNTRLLTFIGGVVSDNGNPAVFVLQGDNITFNGTNIIGRSSIKIARSPQCNHGPVGMILHPTKSQESDLTGTVTGTTLIDVEFINFSQELTDECPQGQPIGFSSSHISYSTFDAPHFFSNVTIDEGSKALDVCRLNQTRGLNDIIIEIVEDPSGSFSYGKQPGFLVSTKLTPFADGPCTQYSDWLDFCENACMRTVRFLTNPVADDCVMIVTDRLNTLTLTRNLRSANPFQTRYDGVYNVALPSGSFEVHYEDDSGSIVFPDYVIQVLEAAVVCSNHIVYGNITVARLAPDASVCSDLVKNGDFDSDISRFQDFFAGIIWDPTSGLGQGGALRSTTRGNPSQSFIQWLYVNCVQENQTYNLLCHSN